MTRLLRLRKKRMEIQKSLEDLQDRVVVFVFVVCLLYILHHFTSYHCRRCLLKKR